MSMEKTGDDTMHGDKVYVPVLATFAEDGYLKPLEITWEDGTHYIIDKVLDIRPAHAAKAGGQGDRYTVRICGRQSYLFFERSPDMGDAVLGRWFVERKRVRK